MNYEFRGFTIGGSVLNALNAYIIHGHPVGHFLTAVLENNLRDAVKRADSEALRNLPAYVGYLHNVADSRCWGSPEKVRRRYAAKSAERIRGDAI